MRQLSLAIAALIVTTLLANRQATCTEIPVVEWTRQLGTVYTDNGNGVCVYGSDYVYVTGRTFGGMDGNTNAGSYAPETYANLPDMFVTQYDSNGNKQWTEQLGTNNRDYGQEVSVDGSGNVYVAGYTYGDLDGNINEGQSDMFLTKYNAAGTKQWTQQLGTDTREFCWGVSVDSTGNAYLTGRTAGGLDGNTHEGGTDMFLVKYNAAGTKQWTKQLGTTSDDYGYDVSLDSSGNAYVTGWTQGDLDGTNEGGIDMFLAKYNASGIRQWTKQLGTASNDVGRGVSVDGSGNAYVAGYTYGDLDGNTNEGLEDMFLTKYDTDGVKQWTEQLGTDGIDRVDGVSVDSDGNAYVAGWTDGDLDGNTNEGLDDIFLVKYDTNGNKLWTCQLGTGENDGGLDVSADSSGNAYVTGYTDGDMYLVKISTIPEPCSLTLLLLGALSLIGYKMHRKGRRQ